MARKKFKDLTLSDAFLFSAALSDEETCRLVLEIILGHPVYKLDVRAEYNVMFSSDYRCARLDVYASDEMRVGYDLEMQNGDEKNLPQRSRYYQAELDVTSLAPGESYRDLRPSYIIFICTFDPFGMGRYQYTFEYRCIETGEALGDGTKRIFLSTKGRNPAQVPRGLAEFLKYINDGTDACVLESNDKAIKELHERITELKKSREMEGRYMQFEELLREEERKGFTEGVAQGETQERNRMLKLISCMASDGRRNELPKLSEDPEFCMRMLKKYQL